MNSSDQNKFEVACRVCGNPVSLDIPRTESAEMNQTLIGLASKGAIHDTCKLQMDNRTNAKKAADLQIARANSWKMLCDPMYRNSDEWLASGQRKVNNVAIAKARQWEWGPRGLICHGQRSGTGKTTSAWLILKQEHHLGRFIIAMTHTEFSRQATMLARDSTPEAMRWKRQLETCDILFVDDLGKSRFKTADNSGKAGEELLFEILDTRIRNELPCLFTSNTDGEGLKTSMSEERGEPFIRRLREFCQAINFDKGQDA